MDRIRTLKEYIKAQPQDSFLQHALALEYIRLGDEQEAKELFMGILNREPAYVGSYYHLGKLLERTGEVEEALKVYQEGIGYARSAGDQHALEELQRACRNLEDDME